MLLPFCYTCSQDISKGVVQLQKGPRQFCGKKFSQDSGQSTWKFSMIFFYISDQKWPCQLMKFFCDVNVKLICIDAPKYLNQPIETAMFGPNPSQNTPGILALSAVP